MLYAENTVGSLEEEPQNSSTIRLFILTPPSLPTLHYSTFATMPGSRIPHNYLFPVPGGLLLFSVGPRSWLLETDPSLPRPAQGGAPLRNVPRLLSVAFGAFEALRDLQQVLREVRPPLPLDK